MNQIPVKCVWIAENISIKISFVALSHSNTCTSHRSFSLSLLFEFPLSHLPSSSIFRSFRYLSLSHLYYRFSLTLNEDFYPLPRNISCPWPSPWNFHFHCYHRSLYANIFGSIISPTFVEVSAEE